MILRTCASPLAVSFAAAISLVASGCVSAQSLSDPRKPPLASQAWGYQPWWMQGNWPAVDLGLWDRVIFFELQVEADGRVGNLAQLPSGWRDMGRTAYLCGSSLDLAFTLFDPAKFEQLFTSAAARDRLLREISALLDASDARGAHLDFEIYKSVSDDALRGFRQFVGRLHERLHEDFRGRVLSVFGPVGGEVDLFDQASLARVDFVVIQGYDAHWRDGPAAGSVAPLRGSHRLTWEKSLQHYLDLGAERSRVLFSIPYFGYEWPVTSQSPGSATVGEGQEMTFAPVSRRWLPKIALSALEQSKRHGQRRDAETESPYYAYKHADGRWRQGWFEDEASLAAKLDFVKRERLAGVAAFPLGYDAGVFDALLGRTLGRRADCRAGGERLSVAGRSPDARVPVRR